MACGAGRGRAVECVVAEFLLVPVLILNVILFGWFDGSFLGAQNSVSVWCGFVFIVGGNDGRESLRSRGGLPAGETAEDWTADH